VSDEELQQLTYRFMARDVWNYYKRDVLFFIIVFPIGLLLIALAGTVLPEWITQFPK